MKNTQAVLFDMDGVILDSEPLHTLARARFLPRWEFPLRRKKNWCWGQESLITGRILNRVTICRNLPRSLWTANSVKFLSLSRRRSCLKAKIFPLCSAFSIKTAFQLPSVQLLPREYVSGVLDYLGIAGYFGTIVCGDEVQNPKPAPDHLSHSGGKAGSGAGALFCCGGFQNGQSCGGRRKDSVHRVPRYRNRGKQRFFRM